MFTSILNTILKYTNSLHILHSYITRIYYTIIYTHNMLIVNTWHEKSGVEFVPIFLPGWIFTCEACGRGCCLVGTSKYCTVKWTLNFYKNGGFLRCPKNIILESWHSTQVINGILRQPHFSCPSVRFDREALKVHRFILVVLDK